MGSGQLLRFAGFRQYSSQTSAMRPILRGSDAILEKRGGKVRYRERLLLPYLAEAAVA